MKSFAEKSLLLLVALAVNLGLYLLVPYIQLMAARGAAKPAKSGKVVETVLAFEPPRRDQLEKRELKPIKTETYRPPSLTTARPSVPGGGLKIDLSAAGGEGPALLSGGDLRGKIGSGSGGGEGSGNAQMTYDPGQTDTDAKPVGDPPLDYPKRAEREGVTGYADLTFVVNEAGFVEQIQVLKEDPAGYDFARAAIESAKRMRFKPATLQKMSVRQRFKRRFNFDLH